MAKVHSQGGDSVGQGPERYSFGRLPDLPGLLQGLLRQVPAGSLVTFGDLAEGLGSKVASRWVAQELASHPHDDCCACHRVVRATGELGGYRPGGGQHEKAARLVAEGVAVSSDRATGSRATGGRVDLPRYRFGVLAGAGPLASLELQQQEIERQIVLSPLPAEPRLVAGVDVSYPAADQGVAAYALVEAASGELLWSMTMARPVRFPYISSFLSYREVPILLELLEAVRSGGRLAHVLLVDGAGIMHPRGAGLAAHLGVLTGLPTIGVTKKLLYGRVDLDDMPVGQPRDVSDEHRTLGAAIRPRGSSGRPIFVSPGHLVDTAGAVRVVQKLLTGRRLPEPIYWADRLSRQASRDEIAQPECVSRTG